MATTSATANTTAIGLAGGSGLARRLVQVDGWLCTLMGAGLAAGAWALAGLVGFESPLPLAAIGAGTLVWGLWLLRAASPARFGRRTILAPLVANIVWVLGSAELLLSGIQPITPTGFWAIAAQADAVALLAIAQAYAFWRGR